MHMSRDEILAAGPEDLAKMRVPNVSGNVLWISPNLVAGGYFEAGEPLLRIDERDYRYALERAGAAVDRAMAEVEVVADEAIPAPGAAGS